MYIASESKKSKRTEQKLSIDNILKDISKKCCRHECLKQLPLQTVNEQRRRVWLKAYGERNSYINSMIEQAELGRTRRTGGKGSSELRFIFNGISVCQPAWCAVQGISRTW